MNTNSISRRVSDGVLVTLFVLSLSFFIYLNARSGMELGGLVVSSLILAVPLGLMYFSAGLALEAWQEHRRGMIGPLLARVLYLTPRIAAIAVCLFIAAFALDVFEMQGDLWTQIGAFLLHAAPALLMLAALVLAWRYAWVGALAFGLGALVFLRFVFPGDSFSFGNLLLFVLPLALIALLFWLNWQWRGELRIGR